MTPRYREIKKLVECGGFSERIAEILLRLAECLGYYTLPPKKEYQGYLTTIADGKMPLNVQAVVNHIGLFVLPPVTPRDLMRTCPVFAQEFKPVMDKYGLPENEPVYILVTGYDVWSSQERGAMAYCACDCGDYTEEDGWQRLCTQGIMFIYTDPYYGMGGADGKKLWFRCSIEAAREVDSRETVLHRFPPGTDWWTLRDMLRQVFSEYNLNHTIMCNQYISENAYAR